MKLSILLFALTLSAIHAQEPPVLPYCAGGAPPSGERCRPVSEMLKSAPTGSNVALSTDSAALAYQTARANALEAENAVLKRTNADSALSIELFQKALTKLMDDKYGNPQQLQAKQAETQKTLDVARDAMKKACGEKCPKEESK